MIRERVSTQGIIRPLEPELELPAMQLPPERVGTLSEHAMRRYITGLARNEKKFARAIRHIEKQRLRNIDRASRDTNRHIAALQHYLERERAADADAASGGVEAGWNLAWALDADERPPPSSIIARRDTEEALKLARVADKAVLASEHALSANNLWGVVVGFLTATPDDPRHAARSDGSGGGSSSRARAHVVGARTGRLGSFFRRKGRSEGSASASGSGQSSSGHG